MPEGHPTWEGTFGEMCRDARTSPEGEEALAVMHPDYPDTFKAWTEVHYEHAGRMFEKHGTLTTVSAAIQAFAKKERGAPEPETPAAPHKILELYESVGERALALGVIDDDEMQAVGLLLDKASPQGVTAADKEITRWQGLVLGHLGQGRS